MKSPAFQFYAADYLADEQVQIMTLEEEGAYIRLLSYCWREGSIPADELMLSRLCKGASTTVVVVVRACFNQHPTDNTRLVHKRLDKEREKQRRWAEKSSEGGKKSAESKRCNKSRVVQPNANSSSSSSSSSSSLEPPIVPQGGPVAVPDPKPKTPSPFQECLQKAAADIHSTHPAHRRDLSAGGTQKHLVSILKHKKLLTAAGKPLDEAMPYLVGIVGIHLRKTQSEDWTKEDGKYVKSLANYLAPTIERYEQEPPALAAPGTYPVRDGPGNGSTKARMSWRGEAMKDMFYPVETT